MKLLNYTSPDLVFAGLETADKRGCLRLLVDRLEALGKTTDADALLADLLQREAAGSTGIGGGIALPHARSAVMVGTLVMIARLQRPIPFEAVDGEPVDLVFLLVGSRELPGQQLRVLARISRLVRLEAFLGDLRGAETPAAILAAVQEAEAKHF